MTLAQILDALNSAADDLCIVARRPWSGSTDAMLVRLDEDGRVPNHVTTAGFQYFLEINIVRDEVLGKWATRLNTSQRLAVVLHYAQHDAWPEWFHEFCHTHKGAGA